MAKSVVPKQERKHNLIIDAWNEIMRFENVPKVYLPNPKSIPDLFI